MSHVTERDWITESGLRAVCLLVDGSHRCGYVEVPVGHPLHGVDYGEESAALTVDPEMSLGKRSPILALTAAVDASDRVLRRSPDVAFDVHGGLTYSGLGDGYPATGGGWWFGFDCAHDGDGQMGRFLDFTPDDPVRTEEYVVAECESLATQLAAVSTPICR